MTITRIEVECFSVTSSRPVEKIVEALKAAVGRPDMVHFAKATAGARTFAELESEVKKGLGRTGLMTFKRTIGWRAFVLQQDGKLPAPYGNGEALAVARDLDSKIESLLRECAA